MRAPFNMRAWYGLSLVGALVLAGRDVRAASPNKEECIAANEQARDLRATGKLKAARARLAIALSSECPDVLRADSQDLLAEIDKAQPEIAFAVKDAAGNDLADVRVTMDDTAFAERLDGTALPVDPGEHLFRFESTTGEVAEKKLVVVQGEKNRREVVALALSTAPSSPPGGGMGSRRIAGIAVGSIGVVAAAIGAGFGAIAIEKKNAADPHCAPDDSCDDTGISLRASGLTVSYASTGLVIGGAALAVTGLALILAPVGVPTASAGSRTRFVLAPNLRGLVFQGVW